MKPEESVERPLSSRVGSGHETTQELNTFEQGNR